jgi:uncharacterized SAM-binding protein YcdF (DUF218 family)
VFGFLFGFVLLHMVPWVLRTLVKPGVLVLVAPFMWLSDRQPLAVLCLIVGVVILLIHFAPEQRKAARKPRPRTNAAEPGASAPSRVQLVAARMLAGGYLFCARQLTDLFSARYVGRHVRT